MRAESVLGGRPRKKGVRVVSRARGEESRCVKTTRSELNWAIMGRMWSLERIGENGCGRMRASSRRGPGADLSRPLTFMVSYLV